MNYKDIEKKINKQFNLCGRTCKFCNSKRYFIKAKFDQVIDEMIGEERKGQKIGKLSILGSFDTYKTGRMKSHSDVGYNQKVQQLKEFKKKFNK